MEQIDFPIELGAGRIDNLDFNGNSGDNNLYLRYGTFNNERKFAYRVSLEKLLKSLKNNGHGKNNVDDFTSIKKVRYGVIVVRDSQKEENVARMAYFPKDEIEYMKSLLE
jgi:hypothetical protein